MEEEAFMTGRRPLLEERKVYHMISFRKKCIVMAVILFMNIPYTGCNKDDGKVSEERVVNVKVSMVEKKSFRPFVGTVGTLKAYEEVIVSSEVDGIVKSIRVDEGSSVSRGMLLAEINDTDYRLEVKRAEAVLRQAEATLANTKLEYDRKSSLYKEELVTKQQFDDVSARLAISDGDLDRARASLSLAKEKLSKTKIYSPLRGFVKEKKANAGDYVRNGTPLVWIIQSDPVKLSFTVPEKDVGKLKAGQDVVFRVDAFPDREFSGRVRNIYPSLEEKTRTLQVEALAPNQGNRLKPGLFAKVTLYTGEARDMVVIPVTAILYDNARIKVFVAEGNVAREKEIKIGHKYGESIEITEGLKQGEIIVVAGQNILSEGVKINVAR
jgi:membrane fusion protein (multidrug efflux system)